MSYRTFFYGLVTIFFINISYGQVPELKLKLDESGNHYVKMTFLNQAWLRYNESNPGTMVLGEERNNTFDIGLRRTRIQFFGQLTDRLFFYTQFGMNNFNYISQNAGNRKVQAFFHDALGEFHVSKGRDLLKLGAGLTICNGLSRFSQPGIGTIMTLDVPVFAQATVDQIDEFSRKLSLYARGQIGRLDYRIALSDPFPITTAGTPPPVLNSDATFSILGHHHQFQGFFMWNFLDKEPNTTPYMSGTYLGKKRIFNLEAGAIYQQKATWSSSGTDTSFHDMMLWSVALYLDLPLNTEKGTAVSAYAGYFAMDYGPNYTRNNGVMNPANGLLSSKGTFNGYGNAFPMFGTGNTVYVQAGYLFPRNFIKNSGTLMPYASMQYGTYQKLNSPMMVFDGGVNWLIDGNNQKFSLGFQNRPVFDAADLKETTRRNMFVLQYQISL